MTLSRISAQLPPNRELWRHSTNWPSPTGLRVVLKRQRRRRFAAPPPACAIRSGEFPYPKRLRNSAFDGLFCTQRMYESL